MRNVRLLCILGLLLASGQVVARAAPAASSSDWPALGFDAAQTNVNVGEHVLTAGVVLKLKVKWTAPDTTASYPVVAAGKVYMPYTAGRKIHLRVYDAATGKKLTVLYKDALGGEAVSSGNLYIAGHVLQQVDLSTNTAVARVAGPSSSGTYLDPQTDHNVVVAGFYGTAKGKSFGDLLAFPPDLSRTLWRVSSLRAQGTIAGGHVLTQVTAGTAFYDETSGHKSLSTPDLHSDWFSGNLLNYTVASVRQGNAALYAYDGTGHKVWSVVVGPRLVTEGWTHAVSQTAVYVPMFKPFAGIEALDPESGTRLWKVRISDVEHLVEANGVLYALSYRLGEPVRLVMMNATTGKIIGAIVLASGYYAFAAQNGLMVADGMVFLRVVGPAGPTLLALGVH